MFSITMFCWDYESPKGWGSFSTDKAHELAEFYESNRKRKRPKRKQKNG